MNEVINERRLQWQCRRGMLELDIILSNFFTKHYEKLKKDEKSAFARLLACEDTDLWAWLVNHGNVARSDLRAIVEKIMAVSL